MSGWICYRGVSEYLCVERLSLSRVIAKFVDDDVSFIIEGDKELLILAQPLFWENIKEFNAYVESLNKPIEKVIANYHSLGLADYAPKAVVMPEGMIEFNKSPMMAGISKKIQAGFGDAADFRTYKRAKGFAVPSRCRVAVHRRS